MGEGSVVGALPTAGVWGAARSCAGERGGGQATAADARALLRAPALAPGV